MLSLGRSAAVLAEGRILRVYLRQRWRFCHHAPLGAAVAEPRDVSQFVHCLFEEALAEQSFAAPGEGRRGDDGAAAIEGCFAEDERPARSSQRESNNAERPIVPGL